MGLMSAIVSRSPSRRNHSHDALWMSMRCGSSRGWSSLAKDVRKRSGLGSFKRGSSSRGNEGDEEAHQTSGRLVWPRVMHEKVEYSLCGVDARGIWLARHLPSLSYARESPSDTNGGASRGSGTARGRGA